MRSLALKAVQFRYGGGNRKDDFALGPLEATLGPGELVFVAGGNGSGKTTLDQAADRAVPADQRRPFGLDGAAVDERNIHWYRGNFAAVFADFCLFEGVADLKPDDLGRQAEPLAVRLKISRRMIAGPACFGQFGRRSLRASGGGSRCSRRCSKIARSSFSTKWAADQDHRYKDFFYQEFLAADAGFG